MLAGWLARKYCRSNIDKEEVDRNIPLCVGELKLRSHREGNEMQRWRRRWWFCSYWSGKEDCSKIV